MFTSSIRFRCLAALTLLIAVSGVVALPVQSAGVQQADTPTPTPEIGVGTETPTATVPLASATPAASIDSLPLTLENIVTFEMLGVREDTLYGPYDSTAIYFSLPADWSLTGGGELHLNMRVFFGGADTLTGAPLERDLAGSLEVSMNGLVVDTIRLNQLGEQSAVIKLAPENLRPLRSGRYELKMFLDSGFTCLLQHQMSVVLRADSFLNLPHTQIEASTDLTLLPRPIVQNSFVPDMATVVIPDIPSAAEHEALLDVAAGFGQMSQGHLSLSYISTSQLTAEIEKSQHLIFVGKPAGLPALADLALPISVTATNFTHPNMGTDDGILQMIVSPWNPAKVVLVVGGNSDAALLKASKAFSSGLVRTGDQTNLAFVAEVRPTIPAVTLRADRTFKELGYPLETAQAIGPTSFEYTFIVPPGQVAMDDSYVDIQFRHAAEINFDLSGLALTLNGVPIGSARFSEETAKSGNLQVNISPTQLQPGVNHLTVNINLAPQSICFDPRVSQLWLSILPESKLHMPLQLASSVATTVPELSQFMRRYAASPSLNNVAFVLPPDDPSATTIAAQLAFLFGQRANLTISELSVVRADSVPDDVRQTRDLIVIGLPTSQPILADLSEVLPASFPPEANMPEENSAAVVFRIPPETSLGYLEFVAAPWRADRTVLVIAGSNEQGLSWAGIAMIDNRLRGRLEGQYAVIRNEQVIIDKFKLGLSVADLASTALPDETPQPALLSGPPPSTERPAWIVPVVVIASGLMLIIIVVVAVISWRQRP